MGALLTDADKAFMRQMTDLAAPMAEENIMFYRYAGQTTGDRAAGIPEQPVYDPPEGLIIPAVANTGSIGIQDLAGGRVLVGDVTFQIRLSVLPPTGDAGVNGTTDFAPGGPGPNDRIVWYGMWFVPTRVQDARAGVSLFWVIRCRRL